MEYESFHEDEISNENMLEDSENLLESEGLLEDSENLEDSEDIFEHEESEDVLGSEDSLELEPEDKLKKSENHIEFPNEAYADLMVLVTRHKLNNKTGNAIIKFFNKHSNLTTSPLPKNIERGREFMDNMTFANLEFKKTLITNYNDNEYFLYHRDLISCVKNILGISGITQDFTLSFNNYTVLYFTLYGIILYCIISYFINNEFLFL